MKGIVGLIWLDDGSTHWSSEYLNWRYGYISLGGEKILNCSKYLLITEFTGIRNPRWIRLEDAVNIVSGMGYRVDVEEFTTRSCSGVCHEWRVARIYAYVSSPRELDRITIELVNRSHKEPIECEYEEIPEPRKKEAREEKQVHEHVEEEPRPVEHGEPVEEQVSRKAIPIFDLDKIIEILLKRLKGVRK